MNVLTDTYCHECHSSVPAAVEFCGDGDVICANCLRKAIELLRSNEPVIVNTRYVMLPPGVTMEDARKLLE